MTGRRGRSTSTSGAHHVKAGTRRRKEYAKKYRKTHPRLSATVQTVADHIDHVIRLAGVDHVGLGSDFDGVGDTLPIGLKDVSMYPNLIAELLTARIHRREDRQDLRRKPAACLGGGGNSCRNGGAQ